ncbi:MAG: hypothetical protein CM15mP49_35820 [Actinomycetota bacterium]|nr:MAG: hypothetical protein CM15mP49_35820 [Actinomycetota bacterium]
MAALGGVPVNRGAADRDAQSSAITALNKVLPSSYFLKVRDKQEILVGETYDGAAFLAARTGAKVIPVGIGGTEPALPPGSKFPKRTRVRIVVGEPMELVSVDGGRVSTSVRKKFTADLRTELQKVFTEALSEAASQLLS